jgi:hypothetical protein
MMDRIKELLSRISSLNDAELQELRDLILGVIDQNNKNQGKVFSEMDFEDMEVLASASQAVRAEFETRDLMSQQRHSDEAALQTFAADVMTPPSGRGPRSSLSAGGVTALTASGRPLSDVDGLAAELVTSAAHLSMASGSDGDRVPVGRISWSRPATRTLEGGTPESVAAALARIASEHAEMVAKTLAEQPESMVAAGGFSTARQPLYDLPGFETEERPVRSALPGLTATRGGVQFSKPPTLANLNGATSVWTNQNDIDAATNPVIRKPAVRVLPGAPVTADLQAVVSRVIYGNLISRANPEFVSATMRLQRVHAAVVAEQQLLSQIGALSTAVTAPASNLGAARVVLPVLERAAAALRNRSRMAADAPLQVFLPAWTRNLMRADLAMQEPGDSTLGVTDQELSRYLAAQKLAVTWALDGESGTGFPTQSADSELAAWPGNVIAYMFPPGGMVFADGGTLDLGIVRDSTLNAANDYEVFFEAWEMGLHRAGESLRLTIPVLASGFTRAAASVNASVS